jgi:hypothetical protein
MIPVTEDAVEGHLMKQAKALRGMVFKLRFMRGWPDRLVLLPGGVLYFFELKRPHGGKFEPLQLRIHKKLRDLGFRVFVCHTKDAIDQTLKEHYGTSNYAR